MYDCKAYAVVLQTKDEKLIELLKAAVLDVLQLAKSHENVGLNKFEVYVDDKYDDQV